MGLMTEKNNRHEAFIHGKYIIILAFIIFRT